ncbi:uncharacterized protein A1O5_11411, partial [Cladophialophora psammophila CBS 110553]
SNSAFVRGHDECQTPYRTLRYGRPLQRAARQRTPPSHPESLLEITRKVHTDEKLNGAFQVDHPF